jgi:gamma-glutamylcyclotransferase (GGCT)/AIG2-like uncharacterized protein YtfP
VEERLYPTWPFQSPKRDIIANYLNEIEERKKKGVDLPMVVPNKPQANRIVVYGTLKQGFYNNGMLGPDATFICDVQVPELALYITLGHLPFATPERDIHPRLKGELWTVSKNALKRVRRMESQAGYREVELTPLDSIGNPLSGGKATMWIMFPKPKCIMHKLPLGDFNKIAVDRAIADAMENWRD